MSGTQLQGDTTAGRTAWPGDGASPCATQLAVDGHVAIITLEHPPVNALHPDMLQSLMVHLQQAQEHSDVRAIVITGAGGRFSAGFDINVFARGVQPALGLREPLMTAFNKLVEAGAKPTVAAVERVALGGGLELAMACNACLSTPGTIMGLPETKLGILPGFGGTQRLPRLVGLDLAIDMMLTGKNLKVHEAEEVGLVTEIVPSEDVLAAAKHTALEIAAGRRPRRQALSKSPWAGGQARATLDAACSSAARQHPGQHQYQLCLDAVQAGVEQGPDVGLVMEGKAFTEAASTLLHRLLVRAFLAQKAAGRAWILGGLGWLPLQLKALGLMLAVLALKLWAALTAWLRIGAVKPLPSVHKKAE